MQKSIQLAATGVTLQSLSSQPNPLKRRIINELVKAIDGAIRYADTYGGSNIVHRLENHYYIHGLCDTDATLYVHSELVEIYKNKGFKKIALQYESDCTKLIIQWDCSLPPDERKRREQIIKEVKIEAKQTPPQISRGGV